MKNLETADKLMLLQGISLIDDGLYFLEWMDGITNEKYFDTLSILRDRFEFFKDNALFDGKQNDMFISKTQRVLDNVETVNPVHKKVSEELNTLRDVLMRERLNKKAD